MKDIGKELRVNTEELVLKIILHFRNTLFPLETKGFYSTNSGQWFASLNAIHCHKLSLLIYICNNKALPFEGQGLVVLLLA